MGRGRSLSGCEGSIVIVRAAPARGFVGAPDGRCATPAVARLPWGGNRSSRRHADPGRARPHPHLPTRVETQGRRLRRSAGQRPLRPAAHGQRLEGPAPARRRASRTRGAPSPSCTAASTRARAGSANARARRPPCCPPRWPSSCCAAWTTRGALAEWSQPAARFLGEQARSAMDHFLVVAAHEEGRLAAPAARRLAGVFPRAPAARRHLRRQRLRQRHRLLGPAAGRGRLPHPAPVVGRLLRAQTSRGRLRRSRRARPIC